MLSGGDGRLSKPSEPCAPWALEIDLLSPVPFNRLGADPGIRRGGALGLMPPEILDFFVLGGCRRLLSIDGLAGTADGDSGDVELMASGLVGRDDKRATPRGGCGKEPILMVLRTVFPATVVGAAAGIGCSFLLLPSVGMLDVECACVVGFGTEPGVGIPLDSAVILLVGIPDCGEADGSRFVSGVVAEVIELLDPFRVFGTGRDGRGPLGGLGEGREGRVVMAILSFALFGAILVRYTTSAG